MPRFIVIADDAQLFVAADLTTAHAPVPKNSIVEGDFVTPGGVWLKVMVVATPDGPSQQPGFMREAALRPDAAQPPEPVLDNEEFCALVDNVARTRGADRDYLMAVAWAGTAGLTQLGNATSSKIGPFQFTQGMWNQIIADAQASDLHLTPAERRRWRPQVEMAAVLTLQLDDRLAAALGKPATLGQLYFGHIFGADVAASLLAGDQSRPFQSDSLAEEDQPLVTTEAGVPRSVTDVLTEVSRRLDEGYRDAAVVLDQQRDDIRFFHAEDGDPAWLMVAREESFRGVFEFPGADNNARIAQYLQVAGTGESADEVPWCGAFMTFCMKSCGDSAAAAAVPSTPARASSWLRFGEEAPAEQRLPGTIVVLKPQTEDSSGHVGMLIEDVAAGQGAPAGKIRLLGGNQGTPQRVCAVDFDADQVAPHGYRRLPGALSVLPPIFAPPAGTTFGALVAGGFFSADPTDHGVHRAKSIRTNNPGALNISSWQPARKGFVGTTQPDQDGNATTIYRTPEHGVASWFHLLSDRYGFGAAGSFAIRTLARRYAGSRPAPGKVEEYVIAWVRLSEGALTSSTVIDITSDPAMLRLAKAMFHHEAGESTPVHDDQILFGIQRERSGTLPA